MRQAKTILKAFAAIAATAFAVKALQLLLWIGYYSGMAM